MKFNSILSILGHSMSDPGTSYRTRDEVQEVRQKNDPINSFKERLVTSGLATAEELKQIDGEVKKEVDAATAIARTDAEIPLEELTTDIYFKNVSDGIRGVLPDKILKHTTNNLAVNL